MVGIQEICSLRASLPDRFFIRNKGKHVHNGKSVEHNQMIRFSVTSNDTIWHCGPPSHWDAHSIAESPPKMFSLTYLWRNNQTNPNWGKFCKITGLNVNVTSTNKILGNHCDERPPNVPHNTWLDPETTQVKDHRWGVTNWLFGSPQ
jgi:hypothetical protein